jgi:hypothetical protein
MRARHYDLTGRTFGKWEVVERDGYIGAYAAWKVQCRECGETRTVKGSYLLRERVKGCRQCDLNLAKRRFVKLTVVRLVGRNKSGNLLWETQCDCGTLVPASASDLRSGRIRSCAKCSRRNQKKQPVEVVATNQIMANYKKLAFVRHIPWGLDRRAFARLLKESCHWCGSPPNNQFVLKRTFERYTFPYNGIDRLDNERGYEEANCVPSCHICNWMKKDLSKEEFIDQARRITLRHQETPCP